MLTVDCVCYVTYELVLTVECLCYVMNEMLVLYAMNMLIDAIDTRRIIESCHEMFMQLECLCNMPCNVSHVRCHVM